MSAAVPELACRKRLRSCESAKKKIQSDDDEKEGKKMWKGDSKVRNRIVSPTLFEKEKRKERMENNKIDKNKMSSDDGDKKTKMCNCDYKVKNGKLSAALSEKEKKKEKLKKSNSMKKMQTNDKEVVEIMWNGHSKVKSRKESTALREKEKKKERLNSTYSDKRMQSDDYMNEENKIRHCDGKVKNGELSATFFEKEKKMRNSCNKGKSRSMSAALFEKEKKKKMLSSDNVEKKMKDEKRKTPLTFSENKMQNSDSKKKVALNTCVVKEKKMRLSESTEMKMRRDDKQKKMNVSSDTSKEKKMEMWSSSNYKKRKREEPPTLFKKEKRMQSDGNGKKIESGMMKEKKICGDGKEKKRKAPFTFFKFICNNFEEFLFLPPSVSLRLEDLTNHHVYLEDSEGKCSKVRLSVVNGSLAFHRGWNIFVSDHLIKWGEFLLFEYTAKKTFSVRVFGRDCRERLHFSVESKRKAVGKKQTRRNRSPDNLVSFNWNSEDIYDDHYIFGDYPRSKEPETHHVAVNTEEDPKRVEHGVGSRPAALDNKDGYLVNKQCKTKGTSPRHSKQNTVILIIDSESSTHENEDTVKLTTSDADSDKHHVTVNTNEDPKRVQSGVGNGPSIVLGDEEENLPDGEYGTNCISLTCSKRKTRGSEITVITDVDPLTHENGDIVRLTTYAQHKEDRSMNIESEPEVVNPTKSVELELQDSDDNLIRKQEINSIYLESITALGKYHNNGKMDINGIVCRKYEAPVGFRCLEKWTKGIVSDQADLNGHGLIKPENPQKADSKSVCDHGAIGLNPVDKCFCSEGTHACVQPILTMPVKESSCPRVYKHRHGETEIDHSIDGKGGDAAVQLQTEWEQLEPVGSIVNIQRNNIPASVNSLVSGNYGAIGLNPAVSEGTYAFVGSVLTLPVEKHSSPDRVSKCGNSRTEIDHNVVGKGTTVQLETKINQLEPVGSIVCNQSRSIPVRANHAVARQPEHCFSKQEDRKSFNRVIPVPLLPMKDEILELDHPLLKINLQFCIPNTTQKWLELPKSLSSAVIQKRQDRKVIMLKDPMKRLWPILYHENSVFVGFTAGWEHFVAANNLQIGDLCELFKKPDDEETVYSVQITKK